MNTAQLADSSHQTLATQCKPCIAIVRKTYTVYHSRNIFPIASTIRQEFSPKEESLFGSPRVSKVHDKRLYITILQSPQLKPRNLSSQQITKHTKYMGEIIQPNCLVVKNSEQATWKRWYHFKIGRSHHEELFGERIHQLRSCRLYVTRFQKLCENLGGL